MARDDFFRWGLKTLAENLKKTVLHYGGLTALSQEAGAKQEEGKWSKAVLPEQLSDRPKLFFLQGQPCYLILTAGEVYAFSGVCPRDHGILTWQDHTNSFICMICGAKYNKTGEIMDLADSVTMFTLKTKSAEGAIWVRITA